MSVCAGCGRSNGTTNCAAEFRPHHGQLVCSLVEHDFAKEEFAEFRNFDHVPEDIPRYVSNQAVDQRTYYVASLFNALIVGHPCVTILRPLRYFGSFLSSRVLRPNIFHKTAMLSPGTAGVLAVSRSQQSLVEHGIHQDTADTQIDKLRTDKGDPRSVPFQGMLDGNLGHHTICCDHFQNIQFIDCGGDRCCPCTVFMTFPA